MRRRRQYFGIRGEEHDTLPIPPSPWHVGLMAVLPLEHWQLILEFGESIDSEVASLLRSWSGNPLRLELDLQQSRGEAVVVFLSALRGRILAAPPLSPQITEEILEDYTSADHERMVEAVEAVFREGLRRGVSVGAWRYP